MIYSESVEARLVAAEESICNGDLRSFCDVLVEAREVPELMSALRADLVSKYVSLQTPIYRDRWNMRIGEFLTWLGLLEDGKTAEDILSEQMAFGGNFDSDTIDRANDNMTFCLDRNYKMTLPFSNEQCSIAWKGCYLSIICRSMKEDSLDTAFRALALSRLPTGAEALTVPDWWKIFKTYSAAAKNGLAVSASELFAPFIEESANELLIAA